MACFEPESVKNPKLAGEVHVFFALQEDGKAKGVKVKKSTLKNKPTETCLVKVVQGIGFPKAVGGVVEVTYPFVFGEAIVEEVPAETVKKVPGSLPNDVVRDTVMKKGSQFKQCFDTQKAKLPELAGKVITEFLVEQDGSVSEAKVTETTLKNADAEACILATVKSLSFRKPDGETGVRITFPFNFQ